MRERTGRESLTIARCGQVLAPAPLGKKDLVIAGGRIVAVAEPGVEVTGIEVEALDLRGLTVAPGFIDNHVHVLGGGGLGFASRAPELQTSQRGARTGRGRWRSSRSGTPANRSVGSSSWPAAPDGAGVDETCDHQEQCRLRPA